LFLLVLKFKKLFIGQVNQDTNAIRIEFFATRIYIDN